MSDLHAGFPRGYHRLRAAGLRPVVTPATAFCYASTQESLDSINE